MHVTARIDRLVHIEKCTWIHHLHSHACICTYKQHIHEDPFALEDEVDARDGKDRQVSTHREGYMHTSA